MKKYVHVWFVLIAVLLTVLLPLTAHANATSKVTSVPTDNIMLLIEQNFKLERLKNDVRTTPPDPLYTLNSKADSGIAIDNISKLIAKHKTIDAGISAPTFNLERKTLNTKPPRLFQSGTASWYGPRFYGRKTASGEVFTKSALTAAHRTLPFGTKLRVTSERTGKSVVVKVNDRGPFSGNRVLDLSHAAAAAIGMIESGLCKVKIEKI